MNCAYWTKIGIKNCGKRFFVKLKHEQANMKGNKIENFNMPVILKSGLVCSSNLEKVINLMARFCSMKRGFILVGYVLPHIRIP